VVDPLEQLRAAQKANDPNAWAVALEIAEPQQIARAIGDPYLPLYAIADPFRESARAMVQVKLTQRTVDEMKRLERAGLRLAIVGILVAIPSAIIAAIQLYRLFTEVSS